MLAADQFNLFTLPQSVISNDPVLFSDSDTFSPPPPFSPVLFFHIYSLKNKLASSDEIKSRNQTEFNARVKEDQKLINNTKISATLLTRQLKWSSWSFIIDVPRISVEIAGKQVFFLVHFLSCFEFKHLLIIGKDYDILNRHIEYNKRT